MSRPIALLVVLAASLATPVAADTGRIEVAVGQTIEVDVGTRRGLICDDIQIITPTLETRGDHNFLIITGNTVGTTQCRIGTQPGQLSVLYDIAVTLPKKSR